MGEYERAFYGSQYAAMAPLFEHYRVQLWMPEAGGRVDYGCEHDERAMTVLGLSSKREITRTSIRHEPRRPVSRLHGCKPPRDPSHQIIELFPPPGRGYAEPSGHRRIVMRRHKP